MAQCQWQLNFQTRLKKEISWKSRVSINRGTRIYCFPKRLQIAECCRGTSTSFPLSLTTTRRRRARQEMKSQRSDEYKVNDLWKVRRVIESEEEMMEVAAIQADAFYEQQMMEVYSNDFFFQFFKVEQFSNLFYRLKHYAPDRYACLAAEAASSDEEEQHLVGVIDAIVNRDKDILQYLPLATKYIYISGIAVLNKFRRQKVATALLKACDVLARFWGIEYLVLKSYEDDFGARQLYTNAGYKLVSADAPSKTKWIPQRRRVLMVKQVSHEST